MSKTLTHPNGVKKYPEDERIHAMTRAAFIGVKDAAKELDIPRNTLSDWCYGKYRDDYYRLREQEIEQRKAFEAERMMDAAASRRVLAAKLSEDLEAKYQGLEPRDLSTAVRNLDVGAGIYTTKANELRGELHARERVKDFSEIMQGLKASGIEFKVEVSNSAPTKDAETHVEGEAVEVGES